jgi:hypothetical protein
MFADGRAHLGCGGATVGSMRRATTVVAGLASLALAACAGDGDGDGTVITDTELRFRTGPFEVPVGDSFTCFYTDVFSPRELSVYGASGGQGPGGHHIIAYYADEPRPVGSHPCTDEEMTNLNQIGGTAGEGDADGILALHDDLALKVPEGKQMVLQAHCINTTDAAYTVDDNVSLHLMDPADVFAYVNYFVTNDDTFEIPPSSNYTHTTYCTVNRDLDVVLTLGHMHEDGRNYTLEIVDGSGAIMQSLRSDVWQPSFTSHPPVSHDSVSQPLHIPRGTRLRQSCEWDNPTTRTVIFPREMCLSFMYYFPGDGEDIVCDMTAE